MRDRLVIKILGVYLSVSGAIAIFLGLQLIGSGVHLGFHLNRVCPVSSPFQVPDNGSIENSSCSGLVAKIMEILANSEVVSVAAFAYGGCSILITVFLWVWLARENN